MSILENPVSHIEDEKGKKFYFYTALYPPLDPPP